MSTLDTRKRDWHELSTTVGTANASLTAIASKVPTLTKPATDETSGRFVFRAGQIDNGNVNDNPVHEAFSFAASGADNETPAARIWGWAAKGDVFEPHLLADLTMVASAMTGPTGATSGPDNTWRLMDAITVVSDGTRGNSVEVHASGTDAPAMVSLDISGFPLIEVEVARGATGNMRAWHRPL